MRAFLFDKYKHPLREDDVPEPHVGAHDVLVQVAATGLNQIDERIRRGEFRLFMPYEQPTIVGFDLAGTVVSVGGAVRDFAPGDKVYARVADARMGTLAERVSVDESDLAPAPTTIDAVEAASLPLVALTAWQALVDLGDVQPGQKVLIQAGAGGVGSIAIQLAKHLGATAATTVSARNEQFVRELGADVVIDYHTQSLDDELSGYDFVLDSLGGKAVSEALRVLRPGGKVVGISGPPTPQFARSVGMSPLLRLGVRALSFGIRRQARRAGVSYEFMMMHSSGDQLRTISALVDSGAIRPEVGATFSFDEAPQAVAAMVKGGIRGKVVVLGA